MTDNYDRERVATELLAEAEREFLLAHGWRPDPNDRHDDGWFPPPGYYEDSGRQDQSHRTGHAVNSQKYANGRALARRRSADRTGP